ncbi:hypothetical protein PCE1_003747 [Barthelona sp. PCE]
MSGIENYLFKQLQNLSKYDKYIHVLLTKQLVRSFRSFLKSNGGRTFYMKLTRDKNAFYKEEEEKSDSENLETENLEVSAKLEESEHQEILSLSSAPITAENTPNMEVKKFSSQSKVTRKRRKMKRQESEGMLDDIEALTGMKNLSNKEDCIYDLEFSSDITTFVQYDQEQSTRDRNQFHMGYSTSINQKEESQQILEHKTLKTDKDYDMTIIYFWKKDFGVDYSDTFQDVLSIGVLNVRHEVFAREISNLLRIFECSTKEEVEENLNQIDNLQLNRIRTIPVGNDHYETIKESKRYDPKKEDKDYIHGVASSMHSFLSDRAISNQHMEDLPTIDPALLMSIRSNVGKFSTDKSRTFTEEGVTNTLDSAMRVGYSVLKELSPVQRTYENGDGNPPLVSEFNFWQGHYSRLIRIRQQLNHKSYQMILIHANSMRGTHGKDWKKFEQELNDRARVVHEYVGCFDPLLPLIYALEGKTYTQQSKETQQMKRFSIIVKDIEETVDKRQDHSPNRIFSMFSAFFDNLLMSLVSNPSGHLLSVDPRYVNYFLRALGHCIKKYIIHFLITNKAPNVGSVNNLINSLDLTKIENLFNFHYIYESLKDFNTKNIFTTIELINEFKNSYNDSHKRLISVNSQQSIKKLFTFNIHDCFKDITRFQMYCDRIIHYVNILSVYIPLTDAFVGAKWCDDLKAAINRVISSDTLPQLEADLTHTDTFITETDESSMQIRSCFEELDEQIITVQKFLGSNLGKLIDSHNRQKLTNLSMTEIEQWGDLEIDGETISNLTTTEGIISKCVNKLLFITSISAIRIVADIKLILDRQVQHIVDILLIEVNNVKNHLSSIIKTHHRHQSQQFSNFKLLCLIFHIVNSPVAYLEHCAEASIGSVSQLTSLLKRIGTITAHIDDLKDKLLQRFSILISSLEKSLNVPIFKLRSKSKVLFDLNHVNTLDCLFSTFVALMNELEEDEMFLFMSNLSVPDLSPSQIPHNPSLSSKEQEIEVGRVKFDRFIKRKDLYWSFRNRLVELVECYNETFSDCIRSGAIDVCKSILVLVEDAMHVGLKSISWGFSNLDAFLETNWDRLNLLKESIEDYKEMQYFRLSTYRNLVHTIILDKKNFSTCHTDNFKSIPTLEQFQEHQIAHIEELSEGFSCSVDSFDRKSAAMFSIPKRVSRLGGSILPQEEEFCIKGLSDSRNLISDVISRAVLYTWKRVFDIAAENNTPLFVVGLQLVGPVLQPTSTEAAVQSRLGSVFSKSLQVAQHLPESSVFYKACSGISNTDFSNFDLEASLFEFTLNNSIFDADFDSLFDSPKPEVIEESHPAQSPFSETLSQSLSPAQSTSEMLDLAENKKSKLDTVSVNSMSGSANIPLEPQVSHMKPSTPLKDTPKNFSSVNDVDGMIDIFAEVANFEEKPKEEQETFVLEINEKIISSTEEVEIDSASSLNSAFKNAKVVEEEEEEEAFTSDASVASSKMNVLTEIVRRDPAVFKLSMNLFKRVVQSYKPITEVIKVFEEDFGWIYKSDEEDVIREIALNKPSLQGFEEMFQKLENVRIEIQKLQDFVLPEGSFIGVDFSQLKQAMLAQLHQWFGLYSYVLRQDCFSTLERLIISNIGLMEHISTEIAKLADYDTVVKMINDIKMYGSEKELEIHSIQSGYQLLHRYHVGIPRSASEQVERIFADFKSNHVREFLTPLHFFFDYCHSKLVGEHQFEAKTEYTVLQSQRTMSDGYTGRNSYRSITSSMQDTDQDSNASLESKGSIFSARSGASMHSRRSGTSSHSAKHSRHGRVLESMRHKAATIIQRVWRGYVVRRDLRKANLVYAMSESSKNSLTSLESDVLALDSVSTMSSSLHSSFLSVTNTDISGRSMDSLAFAIVKQKSSIVFFNQMSRQASHSIVESGILNRVRELTQIEGFSSIFQHVYSDDVIEALLLKTLDFIWNKLMKNLTEAETKIKTSHAILKTKALEFEKSLRTRLMQFQTELSGMHPLELGITIEESDHRFGKHRNVCNRITDSIDYYRHAVRIFNLPTLPVKQLEALARILVMIENLHNLHSNLFQVISSILSSSISALRLSRVAKDVKKLSDGFLSIWHNPKNHDEDSRLNLIRGINPEFNKGAFQQSQLIKDIIHMLELGSSLLPVLKIIVQAGFTVVHWRHLIAELQWTFENEVNGEDGLSSDIVDRRKNDVALINRLTSSSSLEELTVGELHKFDLIYHADIIEKYSRLSVEERDIEIHLKDITERWPALFFGFISYETDSDMLGFMNNQGFQMDSKIDLASDIELTKGSRDVLDIEQLNRLIRDVHSDNIVVEDLLIKATRVYQEMYDTEDSNISIAPPLITRLKLWFDVLVHLKESFNDLLELQNLIIVLERLFRGLFDSESVDVISMNLMQVFHTMMVNWNNLIHVIHTKDDHVLDSFITLRQIDFDKSALLTEILPSLNRSLNEVRENLQPLLLDPSQSVNRAYFLPEVARFRFFADALVAESAADIFLGNSITLLFPMLKSVLTDHKNPNLIVGTVGRFGEMLQFDNSIDIFNKKFKKEDEDVFTNQYLLRRLRYIVNQIEIQVRLTVQILVRSCFTEYTNSIGNITQSYSNSASAANRALIDSLSEVCLNYTGQAMWVAALIDWTRFVKRCITHSKRRDDLSRRQTIYGALESSFCEKCSSSNNVLDKMRLRNAAITAHYLNVITTDLTQCSSKQDREVLFGKMLQYQYDEDCENIVWVCVGKNLKYKYQFDFISINQPVKRSAVYGMLHTDTTGNALLPIFSNNTVDAFKRAFAGIIFGGLTVVSGAAGMGKSTFVQQCCTLFGTVPVVVDATMTPTVKQLSNFCEGCALTLQWVFIQNLHVLPADVLSRLSVFVHSIRMRMGFMNSDRKTVFFGTTENPINSIDNQDIRAVMRPVRLPKNVLSGVVEAKLVLFGFPEASIFAKKLIELILTVQPKINCDITMSQISDIITAAHDIMVDINNQLDATNLGSRSARSEVTNTAKRSINVAVYAINHACEIFLHHMTKYSHFVRAELADPLLIEALKTLNQSMDTSSRQKALYTRVNDIVNTYFHYSSLNMSRSSHANEASILLTNEEFLHSEIEEVIEALHLAKPPAVMYDTIHSVLEILNDRNAVHICGPPECGKTTLVEIVVNVLNRVSPASIITIPSNIVSERELLKQLELASLFANQTIFFHIELNSSMILPLYKCLGSNIIANRNRYLLKSGIVWEVPSNAVFVFESCTDLQFNRSIEFNNVPQVVVPQLVTVNCLVDQFCKRMSYDESKHIASKNSFGNGIEAMIGSRLQSHLGTPSMSMHGSVKSYGFAHSEAPSLAPSISGLGTRKSPALSNGSRARSRISYAPTVLNANLIQDMQIFEEDYLASLERDDDISGGSHKNSDLGFSNRGSRTPAPVSFDIEEPEGSDIVDPEEESTPCLIRWLCTKFLLPIHALVFIVSDTELLRFKPKTSLSLPQLVRGVIGIMGGFINTAIEKGEHEFPFEGMVIRRLFAMAVVWTIGQVLPSSQIVRLNYIVLAIFKLPGLPRVKMDIAATASRNVLRKRRTTPRSSRNQKASTDSVSLRMKNLDIDLFTSFLDMSSGHFLSLKRYVVQNDIPPVIRENSVEQHIDVLNYRYPTTVAVRMHFVSSYSIRAYNAGYLPTPPTFAVLPEPNSKHELILNAIGEIGDADFNMDDASILKVDFSTTEAPELVGALLERSQPVAHETYRARVKNKFNTLLVKCLHYDESDRPDNVMRLTINPIVAGKKINDFGFQNVAFENISFVLEFKSSDVPMTAHRGMIPVCVSPPSYDDLTDVYIDRLKSHLSVKRGFAPSLDSIPRIIAKIIIDCTRVLAGCIGVDQRALEDDAKGDEINLDTATLKEVSYTEHKTLPIDPLQLSEVMSIIMLIAPKLQPNPIQYFQYIYSSLSVVTHHLPEEVNFKILERFQQTLKENNITFDPAVFNQLLLPFLIYTRNDKYNITYLTQKSCANYLSEWCGIYSKIRDQDARYLLSTSGLHLGYLLTLPKIHTLWCILEKDFVPDGFLPVPYFLYDFLKSIVKMLNYEFILYRTGFTIDSNELPDDVNKPIIFMVTEDIVRSTIYDIYSFNRALTMHTKRKFTFLLLAHQSDQIINEYYGFFKTDENGIFYTSVYELTFSLVLNNDQLMEDAFMESSSESEDEKEDIDNEYINNESKQETENCDELHVHVDDNVIVCSDKDSEKDETPHGVAVLTKFSMALGVHPGDLVVNVVRVLFSMLSSRIMDSDISNRFHTICEGFFSFEGFPSMTNLLNSRSESQSKEITSVMGANRERKKTEIVEPLHRSRVIVDKFGIFSDFINIIGKIIHSNSKSVYYHNVSKYITTMNIISFLPTMVSVVESIRKIQAQEGYRLDIITKVLNRQYDLRSILETNIQNTKDNIKELEEKRIEIFNEFSSFHLEVVRLKKLLKINLDHDVESLLLKFVDSHLYAIEKSIEVFCEKYATIIDRFDSTFPLLLHEWSNDTHSFVEMFYVVFKRMPAPDDEQIYEYLKEREHLESYTLNTVPYDQPKDQNELPPVENEEFQFTGPEPEAESESDNVNYYEFDEPNLFLQEQHYIAFYKQLMHFNFAEYLKDGKLFMNLSNFLDIPVNTLQQMHKLFTSKQAQFEHLVEHIPSISQLYRFLVDFMAILGDMLPVLIDESDTEHTDLLKQDYDFTTMTLTEQRQQLIDLENDHGRYTEVISGLHSLIKVLDEVVNINDTKLFMNGSYIICRLLFMPLLPGWMHSQFDETMNSVFVNRLHLPLEASYNIKDELLSLELTSKESKFKYPWLLDLQCDFGSFEQLLSVLVNLRIHPVITYDNELSISLLEKLCSRTIHKGHLREYRNLDPEAVYIVYIDSQEDIDQLHFMFEQVNKVSINKERYPVCCLNGIHEFKLFFDYLPFLVIVPDENWLHRINFTLTSCIYWDSEPSRAFMSYELTNSIFHNEHDTLKAQLQQYIKDSYNLKTSIDDERNGLIDEIIQKSELVHRTFRQERKKIRERKKRFIEKKREKELKEEKERELFQGVPQVQEEYVEVALSDVYDSYDEEQFSDNVVTEDVEVDEMETVAFEEVVLSESDDEETVEFMELGIDLVTFTTRMKRLASLKQKVIDTQNVFTAKYTYFQPYLDFCSEIFDFEREFYASTDLLNPWELRITPIRTHSGHWLNHLGKITPAAPVGSVSRVKALKRSVQLYYYYIFCTIDPKLRPIIALNMCVRRMTREDEQNGELLRAFIRLNQTYSFSISISQRLYVLSQSYPRFSKLIVNADPLVVVPELNSWINNGASLSYNDIPSHLTTFPLADDFNALEKFIIMLVVLPKNTHDWTILQFVSSVLGHRVGAALHASSLETIWSMCDLLLGKHFDCRCGMVVYGDHIQPEMITENAICQAQIRAVPMFYDENSRDKAINTFRKTGKWSVFYCLTTDEILSALQLRQDPEIVELDIGIIILVKAKLYVESYSSLLKMEAVRCWVDNASTIRACVQNIAASYACPDLHKFMPSIHGAVTMNAIVHTMGVLCMAYPEHFSIMDCNPAAIIMTPLVENVDMSEITDFVDYFICSGIDNPSIRTLAVRVFQSFFVGGTYLLNNKQYPLPHHFDVLPSWTGMMRNPNVKGTHAFSTLYGDSFPLFKDSISTVFSSLIEKLPVALNLTPLYVVPSMTQLELNNVRLIHAIEIASQFIQNLPAINYSEEEWIRQQTQVLKSIVVFADFMFKQLFSSVNNPVVKRVALSLISHRIPDVFIDEFPFLQKYFKYQKHISLFFNFLTKAISQLNSGNVIDVSLLPKPQYFFSHLKETFLNQITSVSSDQVIVLGPATVATTVPLVSGLVTDTGFFLPSSSASLMRFSSSHTPIIQDNEIVAFSTYTNENVKCIFVKNKDIRDISLVFSQNQ